MHDLRFISITIIFKINFMIGFQDNVNFGEIHRVFANISLDVLIILAPLMSVMVILAIAANIGQFGHPQLCF